MNFVPDLPWQPQSYITGNLAIGNLRENLLRLLRTKSGVHAETLLTAAGALVGFSAQHAALLRGAEATSKMGIVPKYSIIIAGTADGRKFIIGDWPNSYLFPNMESQLTLFGFIAGKAIEAGVNEKDLPDFKEMAAHVARAIGSPGYGAVRVQNGHQPIAQPYDLVKMLWPHVVNILQMLSPDHMHIDEPPLEPAHWPIVLSIVASNFITATKNGIDPRIGSALVMEAAIIAAKIFPELIQPGNWRIEAKNGELAVTRLGN